MQIKNNAERYGLVSVLLHWISALVIFFLFAVGLYMVELDYYDPGYQIWPARHKSFGILLAMLLVFRLIWLVMAGKPKSLDSHQRWEVGLAHLTHLLIYLCLLTIIVSGYLISTAEGDPISVLGWFNIPALVAIGKQSDLAGEIHQYAAYTLMAIVMLHILGAIKHAIIDRDRTVARIFGR